MPVPQCQCTFIVLDLIHNPTTSTSPYLCKTKSPSTQTLDLDSLACNRAATARDMGRIFVVELEGRSYRCKFCGTHLALPVDLVSRAFHCRRGKAYLFNNAVNIIIGAMEERMMLSGMHTVADIFCCCCGQIIGWKYEAAHEKSQKYKVGKFVLERGRIVDEMDLSTGVFIDTHSGMSDGEDA